MKEPNGAIRIGHCEIHPTAQLCCGAVIGKRFRKFLDGSQEQIGTTVIGENAYVGHYTIVGSGSVIGPGVIIDDFCVIESRVTISEKGLIIYRAQICNDAHIGAQCIIGGFITEKTRVGNGCRVFGKIIHRQHDPTLSWDDDDSMEESATIEDFAFIGFDAIVVGNVTIGRKAYVCAGAIITRDVPPVHIASGINEIVHFLKWKGKLKTSILFKDGYD